MHEPVATLHVQYLSALHVAAVAYCSAQRGEHCASAHWHVGLLLHTACAEYVVHAPWHLERAVSQRHHAESASHSGCAAYANWHAGRHLFDAREPASSRL